MPHYWYAVPMQRYLDRVELELFHKWTDDQRSQLLQVVDQHLARPDVRGSLDKIDWYEVAFHMKHSRNSCRRTYENLQHNRLRTGFFSPEEDRALLREWLDHGYKNMNFERALPNRARNAYPVQRLQRLLNGFVRGKPNDIGFQLCSELGVSLDQASAHMTRNRKPK